MQIEGPDGSLHLEVDGDDGKPPVLCLHGITQSSATWAWLVPDLVDTHQVFRLDFRGHGESDRTPGSYSALDYRADAVAACEAIGRPVVAIGHSLGGGTAAGLAQNHGELVRGIVLEDAPLMLESERLESSLREVFALLREAVPQMQEAGMSAEDIATTMAPSPTASGSTMGEQLTDDGMATMAQALVQLDASVLDAVLDDTMGAFVDPLAPIGAPGVVLAADPSMPDHVTRPLDLERVRAHNADIATVTVHGAGHLIHDSREHRGAVLSAVTEFLDRLA